MVSCMSVVYNELISVLCTLGFMACQPVSTRVWFIVLCLITHGQLHFKYIIGILKPDHAYSSSNVDVGVIYLGEKPHVRWLEGVPVRDLDF